MELDIKMNRIKMQLTLIIMNLKQHQQEIVSESGPSFYQARKHFITAKSVLCWKCKVNDNDATSNYTSLGCVGKYWGIKLVNKQS